MPFYFDTLMLPIIQSPIFIGGFMVIFFQKKLYESFITINLINDVVK